MNKEKINKLEGEIEKLKQEIAKLPEINPEEHGRCRNCGHGDSLTNGLCGFCNKAKRDEREKVFSEIIKGLPRLYSKKAHTCSSKTKRLDIEVLIKYLNNKKKELGKNGGD